MNDDDFSNIVRSGTDHHVSVSELTGNAKNPKNIVSSHEEETEARQRAFEAKERAALEAEKALADVLAEHIEHVPPSDNGSDANIQHIASDTSAPNRQSIAANAGSPPNIQSLGHDAVAANRQAIAVDDAANTHRQVIASEGMAPNVQTIPVDALTANRQTIENDAEPSTHSHALPRDETTPNRQALGQDSHADRSVQTASDVLGDQSVGLEAASLNRQAAPDNAAPGPNRQSVGHDQITAHFEPLPADDVARRSANLPSAAPMDGVSTAAHESASHTPSPASALAQTHGGLTSADQLQVAKLKREKTNDAFHGRLAGIKHDVDQLNHRLSDFEEQVEKEDAKLDKGNPDNFQVKLD